MLKNIILKKNNLNIEQVVNFIFNSIAFISLLHRNKSNKSIFLYKKSLYQFIYNLGYKKITCNLNLIFFFIKFISNFSFFFLDCHILSIYF